MFGGSVFVILVLLSDVITNFPAGSVRVKRSVLEESVMSLFKAEEKRNANFQSTVLKTLTGFQKKLEGIDQTSTKPFERILSKLYCPSHFRYVEHSCYKVSSELADWKTANATCLENYSHLVTIDNNYTGNSVLRSLIGRESLKNDDYLWAGGKGSGEDMGSILSSNLLNADHIALLKEWFPGKKFNLLYRASRDGMSQSAFHRNCDRKGATLSIGKDHSSGSTLGGYASVSWTHRGSYKRDSNAFVFRLCGQGCTSAKYTQYRYQQKAVFDHYSYGPTFGGGHDLLFFTGSRTYDRSNTCFPSNGYCKSSPYTYNGRLGCGGSVKWTDVEVWSVVDDPALNLCLALNVGNQSLELKSCTDKARYICEL